VWAVSPDNGAVSSINPRDDAVVSVTTVQGQPDRVAVNDGLVWVGSTSGPTLVALSEATGKLVRVVALPAPVAQLVAQGPRLWVLLR
jgi:sugar lactone lactonase YvrE